VVVAVGGGSVLDAGKALAMLLANPGDPLDYAEVIGAGRPIAQPSVPFIAVPTTAGTGSEATRNAVLGSPAHGVKVSLRSPLMLPRVALVDPELALGLPPALTAATGMDALAQLIEPFVSCRANPLVDALCRDGIPRIAHALPRAFPTATISPREPTSRWARFIAASPWPTPGWARCMASREPSAGPSRRPTGRSARDCCPGYAPQISNPWKKSMFGVPTIGNFPSWLVC
jgi:alcohol dehydrogenase class IV